MRLAGDRLAGQSEKAANPRSCLGMKTKLSGPIKQARDILGRFYRGDLGYVRHGFIDPLDIGTLTSGPIGERKHDAVFGSGPSFEYRQEVFHLWWHNENVTFLNPDFPDWHEECSPWNRLRYYP